MSRTSLVLLLAGSIGLLAGCGGDDTPTRTGGPPTDTSTDATVPGPGIALRPFASGLDAPVQTLAVPGTDGDVWVVERRGVVRLVRDGRLATDPMLDISSRVRSEGGEQGLLSLAFHPEFMSNGRVYIHNSDPRGDTLVSEHRVFGGAIDPEPVRTLLSVDQPYSNHNGGSLAFGPDGLLYLGLGDGGSANDPENHAQNMDSRLGKLLRVDVDGPSTEPAWEIAALGLRNPWRFAFDPDTGSAWIADVGQNAVEEINVFPRGSRLLNYGWKAREGTRDAAGPSVLSDAGELTNPVAEYTHADGCSITGGGVVRNPGIPALNGRYLYTDFCSGTVWSVAAGGDRTPRTESISLTRPSSIDVTPGGRIMVTSLDGTVQEVVAAG